MEENGCGMGKIRTLYSNVYGTCAIRILPACREQGEDLLTSLCLSHLRLFLLGTEYSGYYVVKNTVNFWHYYFAYFFLF
jgi:hypothetical protein